MQRSFKMDEDLCCWMYSLSLLCRIGLSESAVMDLICCVVIDWQLVCIFRLSCPMLLWLFSNMTFVANAEAWVMTVGYFFSLHGYCIISKFISVALFAFPCWPPKVSTFRWLNSYENKKLTFQMIWLGNLLLSTQTIFTTFALL